MTGPGGVGNSLESGEAKRDGGGRCGTHASCDTAVVEAGIDTEPETKTITENNEDSSNKT